MNIFSDIPHVHSSFLQNSVPKLQQDPRILGVAAGGSMLLGTMDEFSDLDLIVVVAPEFYAAVLRERKNIVGNIDTLIEAFTGEHVGESRLLICLYGPPLLHVDFKFISIADINDRVEDPLIVWERENALSRAMDPGKAKFPHPDPQWIEERFWTWVHYGATKIGRGELFETLDFISFLRTTVIGPLILEANNARPQGVRKIENHATQEQMERLLGTVATYTRQSCIQALRELITLYKSCRRIEGNAIAEQYAID
ncbi:MAG: nucleotidyltransferase domain-containing protein, partial [Opitutales bacterium]|nr:nucleotidyltransferase domain-containing protein [Opitutales bacterium]